MRAGEQSRSAGRAAVEKLRRDGEIGQAFMKRHQGILMHVVKLQQHMRELERAYSDLNIGPMMTHLKYLRDVVDTIVCAGDR